MSFETFFDKQCFQEDNGQILVEKNHWYFKLNCDTGGAKEQTTTDRKTSKGHGRQANEHVSS